MGNPSIATIIPAPTKAAWPLPQQKQQQQQQQQQESNVRRAKLGQDGVQVSGTAAHAHTKSSGAHDHYQAQEIMLSTSTSTGLGGGRTLVHSLGQGSRSTDKSTGRAAVTTCAAGCVQERKEHSPTGLVGENS